VIEIIPVYLNRVSIPTRARIVYAVDREPNCVVVANRVASPESLVEEKAVLIQGWRKLFEQPVKGISPEPDPLTGGIAAASFS
jgi:hypothetical protein